MARKGEPPMRVVGPLFMRREEDDVEILVACGMELRKPRDGDMPNPAAPVQVPRRRMESASCPAEAITSSRVCDVAEFENAPV